ncbi:MAG: hypothetical protein KDL87_17950, partial [Verrucomicrobiae bacterium]|nr:hypothetical protein [Verrucomicrobiae bacterium]
MPVANQVRILADELGNRFHVFGIECLAGKGADDGTILEEDLIDWGDAFGFPEAFLKPAENV